METKLGQKEQKALQGHQSKESGDKDSKERGFFLPLIPETGGSVSNATLGPRQQCTVAQDRVGGGGCSSCLWSSPVSGFQETGDVCCKFGG